MSTTLDSLPKFDLASYKSLPDDTLTARIQAIRDQMGGQLVILGHHYQRDHVIALADLRGDSYRLSQLAAENDACRAIAFCGVHFMAETADILANHPEKVATRGGERITVFLPDAGAGCSMADMAAIEQIEDAWDQLGAIVDTRDITPVTYINSAASLKAFVGKRGGIVCTSSNAKAALEWAFARTGRVMFFPDQHLGRNTALTMGIPVDQMPVWDPYAGPKERGGNTAEAILASRVILWRGYCSVHQVFRPEDVETIRQTQPGIRILVHPECCQEVFEMADEYGSTAQIIRLVESAPPGTKWAIGTEFNLVHRLQRAHPEQEIHFLSPAICLCETMYRIDLAHLCWSLENLAAGTPVNVIEVDEETARWSHVALARMLEVK